MACSKSAKARPTGRESTWKAKAEAAREAVERGKNLLDSDLTDDHRLYERFWLEWVTLLTRPQCDADLQPRFRETEGDNEKSHRSDMRNVETSTGGGEMAARPVRVLRPKVTTLPGTARWVGYQEGDETTTKISDRGKTWIKIEIEGLTEAAMVNTMAVVSEISSSEFRSPTTTLGAAGGSYRDHDRTHRGRPRSPSPPRGYPQPSRYPPRSAYRTGPRRRDGDRLPSSRSPAHPRWDSNHLPYQSSRSPSPHHRTPTSPRSGPSRPRSPPGGSRPGSRSNSRARSPKPFSGTSKFSSNAMLGSSTPFEDGEEGRSPKRARLEQNPSQDEPMVKPQELRKGPRWPVSSNLRDDSSKALPTSPRRGRGPLPDLTPMATGSNSPSSTSLNPKSDSGQAALTTQRQSPGVASPRGSKPVPLGPRGARHVPTTKTSDDEIPARKKDWVNGIGYKEREAILAKLAVHQKAYQTIAVEVMTSGWELDRAMIELEAFKHKRELAEKQYRLASEGLPLLEDWMLVGSTASPSEILGGSHKSDTPVAPSKV